MYKNQVTLLSILLLIGVSWQPILAISDKRLCADAECKKIISTGVTKIGYNAGAPFMASFKANTPVRIYSKEAGTDMSLWGIEVQGRRGYAPKDRIKETKMFVKNSEVTHLVNTEDAPASEQEKVAAPAINEIKPALLPSETSSTTEASTTAPLPLKDAEKAAPSLLTSSTDTAETVLSPAIVGEDTKLVVDLNIENVVDEKQKHKIEKVPDEDTPLARIEEVEEKAATEVRKEIIVESTEVDSKLEEATEQKIQIKSEESLEKPNENAENKGVTKGSIIDTSLPSDAFNKTEEKETVETVIQPGVKDSDFMDARSGAMLDEPTTLAPLVVKIDKNETIENIINEKGTANLKEENKQNTLPEVPNKVGNETNEIENGMKEKPLLPIVTENEISETSEKKESEKLNNSQENSVTSAANNKNETIEHVTIDNNIEYEKDVKKKKSVFEALEINEKTDIDIPKEPLLGAETKEDVENPVDSIVKSETIEISANERKQAQEEINTEAKPTEVKILENTTAPLQILEEKTTLIEKVEPQISNELNESVSNNINDNDTLTSSLPELKSEESQYKSENLTQIVDTKNELDDDKTPLLSTKEEPQITVDLPAESEHLLPIKPLVELPPAVLPIEENLPKDDKPFIGLDMDINNNIDPNDYYGRLQEENLQQEAATKSETEQTQNVEAEENTVQNETENSIPFAKSEEELLPEGYSMPSEFSEEITTEPAVALPSRTPPSLPASVPLEGDLKEQGGLFATILGTVNSFLSSEKKELLQEDDELQRILFADSEASHLKSEPLETQYCEKSIPNSECQCKEVAHLSLEKWVDLAADKVLQMSELLACFVITAVASIVFLFGYYCFCNSSREGALLAKLNYLERSLLAKQKENIILKDDLAQTRHKLSSIEDNSFGSNDMVIALKNELEQERTQNEQLEKQVHALEKELEIAAEAGLELNTIVSDLLSNQTGNESIIDSVEELQRQLKETQNVILEINTNLAEKSRENSELQLMLAEQGARLNGEIASLQQDNDELEADKANLQARFEEMKNEFDEDITKALEGKNFEIKRLQNEITELQKKCEMEHTKWQTSLAKVEALEECLKLLKKDPSVNINEVINVANVRAEALDMQKKCTSMKERLDVELDGRRLAENKLKLATEEVEKLKQNFHQSEKDKLEAQTRLEVLSNYFKDKETQLQKELSLKEAMWLKQQGETTSTVDRLTAMQEEINSLKSQNESLRAEIEAQVAAHKAQIGTLENRAHETWLAARQSERRCEEARAEASALRRRLTALAGGDSKLNNNELNNAASPIHMESPGSPLLGRLPPPGFLPPPPFLGPPPPFMGMPPPPFVPPGEMRPAPLGRIMSPPPPPGSSRHGMRAAYTPPGHRRQRHDFDDEYDDDDDDDYDDEEDDHNRNRSRYSRGSDSWSRNRDDYSPSPRTYRSHSPADSRYNYSTNRDLISTYDTETDFSPPPSPRYKAYSPQPPTASSPINENHSGKKSSSKQSSANKGTGTGTDLERSSKKTHNGRQHGKSNV